MSGPFGDIPVDGPTEYGGHGGGLSVRAEDVAEGMDLPGMVADRANMAVRAPHVEDPVDGPTGLPSVQENP